MNFFSVHGYQIFTEHILYSKYCVSESLEIRVARR